VAHGVLDQVGDHPVQQGGVAGDRGGLEPGDHQQAGRVGVAAVLQRLGGGVGQVGRLPPAGFPLAAGQREQSLEQPLAALGGVADPFGHGAQLRLGGCPLSRARRTTTTTRFIQGLTGCLSSTDR
jgi:hypothetical protein